MQELRSRDGVRWFGRALAISSARGFAERYARGDIPFEEGLEATDDGEDFVNRYLDRRWAESDSRIGSAKARLKSKGKA